ncbi:hypothetical protein AWC38_SpisGene7754 [Stylophora pistillata]|uniref:Uncharacterized protein n=1 Tax=Stylophora pistillata TaxID=50429 RepID=A0A2B4SA22_STYPI|nr:hypothetical protein AWC38_SpisGene7754 [Stylophora pistillata]
MSQVLHSFIARLKKKLEVISKRHRVQRFHLKHTERECDQQAATTVQKYYEVLSLRDIRQEWSPRNLTVRSVTSSLRSKHSYNLTLWPFAFSEAGYDSSLKVVTSRKFPLRRKSGFNLPVPLEPELTPTKVYMAYKTGTTDKNDVKCRMRGEGPESMAHVLAGCPSLAQSKYLERNNFALKVFFFEMLKDLELADSTLPWFSDVKPKPLYKSPDAEAYWDVPVYADHTYVRSNRVDARFIDHKNKKELMVEMSCPWINNRDKKDKERPRSVEHLDLS